MEAVWLIRSRQLARKFRFWLAITGYRPNDKSLTQKIYLVYAAIFFTIWGFAVLSLLASETAKIVSQVPLPSQEAAVVISLLALLGWNLLAAYAACRRSPLVFSEDDAYILCQSPVSRRSVTFAWLAGEWPEQNIVIWGAAVVLGFALVEIQWNGNEAMLNIPYYVYFGMRALSILLPLALGLLEVGWALGIARLRKDNEIPGLQFLPLAFGGLVILYLFIFKDMAGLQMILIPLSYPLRSAYGLQPWGMGFASAAAWVVIGAACLWLVARDLNLSRAGQESGTRAYRIAIFPFFGGRPLEALTGRRPGGAGHSPSRLPARPGLASLVWKDVLQTQRVEFFLRLGAWLTAFSMAFAILLINNWGVQAWALLFWTQFVYTQSTARLQSDLRQWAIFRQLPFSPRDILLADLAGAWASYTLAAWAAAVLGAFIYPSALTLLILILAPILTAGVILAAGWDVLRQSKGVDLLAGNAPAPGLTGLALAAALAVGAVLLSAQLVFALAFLVVGSYLLWQFAVGAVRNIN